MDNNQSSEQRMRLVFMAIGAINALLGAVIMLVYFGFSPIYFLHLDVPNWIIGMLGVTWFFSGVGVVAFAAMRRHT